MPAPVIQLLPIGALDRRLLDDLCYDLSTRFELRCELSALRLDPAFAFHPERRQYHSTQILGEMSRFSPPNCWRLLGITSLDLYMPILTFVFGEAQLTGRCALVSSHRLHQEFYGLPADDGAIRDRLLKEAVHELGHTLGLTHCEQYDCAMASSHSVEWIDIKSAAFCRQCDERAAPQVPARKLFGLF